MPRGMGEYALHGAIETIGGVRFRPEHSGFEMWHSCRMKALSKWTEMCAAVSMVYEKEPVETPGRFDALCDCTPRCYEIVEEPVSTNQR